MKVIFLDFDGVLTTRSTRFDFGDPMCVQALNQITTITDAKIVVSSTWRYAGLKACQDNLKRWGVTGAVIDCTPTLKNINTTRGQEIHNWLACNPGISKFVILDDDTDMDDLCDKLIKCDPMVGLTREHANFAIQKLV